MSECIRTENLCAGYDKPIVRDLCLNVREGEIMTLIGPNGAGKSTVLKTIAGELRKLGGTVSLCCRDADDISPRERAKRLALLLTEQPRASLMTCREVVETGRYPYTGYFGALSREDKIAADMAIKTVNIEDFADSGFLEISDGQRQRVMLARAICQEPKVLILDEPTSYLDIHHKIVFLETLRRLVDEKKIAAVISMHELEFAERISDYAVGIKDGKVQCSGKSADVFTEDVIRKLFDVNEQLYARYFKKN